MNAPTFGAEPAQIAITSTLTATEVVEGVVIAESPERLPWFLSNAYTKARRDLVDQMVTQEKEPLGPSAYRIRVTVEVDTREVP